MVVILCNFLVDVWWAVLALFWDMNEVSLHYWRVVSPNLNKYWIGCLVGVERFEASTRELLLELATERARRRGVQIRHRVRHGALMRLEHAEETAERAGGFMENELKALLELCKSKAWVHADAAADIELQHQTRVFADGQAVAYQHVVGLLKKVLNDAQDIRHPKRCHSPASVRRPTT